MNILTFDIEDWFHTFDKPYYNNPDLWRTLPSAIENDVSRICDILDETNTKATFFTMGWIAEFHPSIIKKISDKGHNIGLHSYSHQKVSSLTEQEFNKDLKKNIDVIEETIGNKVTSYRAPGFSLKANEQWALETMLKLGVNIDSSLISTESFNGIKTLPLSPFRLSIGGNVMYEFPQIKVDIFNFTFFYLSSGYFRLTPIKFIKQKLDSKGYTMSYFHPRDFNTQTHKLFSNPFLKLKYRLGTKSAAKKLSQLNREADFISIDRAYKQLDWDSTPIFDL